MVNRNTKIKVNLGLLSWGDYVPNVRGSLVDLNHIEKGTMALPLLEEFATKISKEGYSCSLAFDLPESEVNPSFFVQELLILSFDVTRIRNMPDLLTDTFLTDNTSFYFETGTNLAKQIHFVFVLDKPITNKEEAEHIYSKLLEKYPLSISCVGRENLMFFGSHLGYTEVDFTNTLDVNLYGLLEPLENITIVEEPFSHEERRPKLLVSYESFSEIFRTNLSIPLVFEDRMSAKNYLLSLNLSDVFELPSVGVFKDIFHKSLDAKAIIYFQPKSESYIYLGLNSDSNLELNIIDIISELKGINFYESFDFITESLGIQVTYSSNVGILEDNWFSFIAKLRSGELANTYPYLAKYLDFYKESLFFVLPRLIEFSDIVDDEKVYRNYHTMHTLAKRINSFDEYPINANSIKVILTTLTVLEIISKEESDFILRFDANRYKNYNVLSNLTPEKLRESEEIARVLIETKVTKGLLSHKSVKLRFGEEKANRDFNQIYKTPQYIQNPEYMDETKKVYDKALLKTTEFLNQHFETNEFITEKELIRVASRKVKLRQKIFIQHYKLFSPQLFTQEGFKKVKLTLKMHERFGIQKKYTHLTTIVREDFL